MKTSTTKRGASTPPPSRRNARPAKERERFLAEFNAAPRTDRRKMRLPRDYYRTADNIPRYCFGDDSPGAGFRATLAETISRLASVAGSEVFNDEGCVKGWNERRTFLEACRVYHFQIATADDPRRDECLRLIRTIETFGSIAIDLKREAPEEKAEAPKTPAPPMTKHRQQATTYINADNHQLECFGLLPGDRLSIESAPDPSPGELIMFYDSKCWAGVGRFGGFAEQVFEGSDTPVPAAFYEDHKGHEWYMKLSVYDIYRILTVTRTIDFTKTDKPGDGREQKLKQLRRRLNQLDGDDITNSTAAFKLEKQIYDLERDIERDAALDEWPEELFRLGETGGAM